MNKSPQRGTFQIEALIKRAEQGSTTVEHAEEMIEFYKSWEQQRAELEATDEWKVDNMEYDLRNTKWICDKAKANEYYAQNIYAAICNNEFTRNDVWPILTDKRWSASWRSAGGIVANMLEKGDYIDWYCSGIHGKISGEEYEDMSENDRKRYHYVQENFVGEGVVTDEVREDLLKLGWIVVPDDIDD